MRSAILLILLFIALQTQGQALREINYRYAYEPDQAIRFQVKAFRQAGGYTVLYRLQLRDTTYRSENFTIQWEGREALNEKVGAPLAITPQTSQVHGELSGTFTLDQAGAPKILVAKVVHTPAKRAWFFYKEIDPAAAMIGYLQTRTAPVFDDFVGTFKALQVKGFDGASPLIVSYYNDNFPAAAPAFSEGQARVSKEMKSDSVYAISPDVELSFDKKGLYLIQKDTNSTVGLSFRAEDGYPKFSRIQDLVGPLVYICTKEEFARLRNSGNDKKQFDRIVLNITQDSERAKLLMRNFFKRVELANMLFTSYKEGWKTDRGMVYIVFGAPDEVFKFSDREVWTYGKTTFNFVKSSTLFDPDNYVLIRDRKYTDEWYEKVDLIRNSRF
ncbi:MAG: GWxTD domain-containing protein [Bacteroidota bacterium]